MGSMSFTHWLIVILVIVLLFGVKKIPDLAKNLGIGIKEFKKAVKDGDKAPDTAEKIESGKPENKDDAKA